jgi:hypothetical protein
MMRKLLVLVGVVAAVYATPVSASPITFTAVGPTPADIAPTVTNFGTALGTLNPNVPGSFGSGRREINWDGVPDALAAPNLLPANFFNVNSPRGVEFATPGTGFQVSANAGVAPVEFGNLNPLYSTEFSTFSPQRLFTALGSTITDVNFFVPGSSNAATTNGFGVVFTDVDLLGSTTVQFFNQFGAPLLTLAAPSFPGSGSLSFVGALFTTERIRRVRITSGNVVLGSSAEDFVAMDDFIYGEPTAVPEPASLSLSLLGSALAAAIVQRRRRARGLSASRARCSPSAWQNA